MTRIDFGCPDCTDKDRELFNYACTVEGLQEKLKQQDEKIRELEKGRLILVTFEVTDSFGSPPKLMTIVESDKNWMTNEGKPATMTLKMFNDWIQARVVDVQFRKDPRVDPR